MALDRKILATRRIIARATPEQLDACRAGYARIDNDAARRIVRLCDEEATRRAEPPASED